MPSAIAVSHLSKRYRVGHAGPRYDTFTDLFAELIRRPFRVRQPDPPDATFWALRDVGFEIQPGEVVGIIGRNGAGKSTLLKILSRITAPTEGRIEIRGRVASLLEVGTGFHPELTGRENVYMNGSILGMTRAEIDRKFDEIVDFASVERFLDTPLKRYSSGMQVRLAFAVAAHLDPEILIVDEVLAVGDAEFQRKCLGKMSEVAKGGRTVLFVSHNMSAIIALCSRGIWLERGRSCEDGPVNAVVQSYARAAIGTTQSDLSQITIREGAGRVRFVRYWLEAPRGQLVEHAISGQEVHVLLEYESRLEAARNCRVSISVDSLLGQQLFVCSTELTMDHEVRLCKRGVAVCTVPRFPLTSGEYAMTLFLEADREVEDCIQSSARLSVVDGDFFGTGRQCPQGWEGKCVIVPHSWRLEDALGSAV